MSKEGKWVVWEAKAHFWLYTVRDNKPEEQLTSTQTEYDNSVLSTLEKIRHY